MDETPSGVCNKNKILEGIILNENLKCTYCGYVLTEEDSNMMWQEFCPMCEKERKVDLCPDCKVYCEKRFEDGRCE